MGEAPGNLGVAGKVWDGAIATIQWLQEHSEERVERWIRGKHILELGSGTGVLALMLGAWAPASVTMTDLPEAVPLMELNVAITREVGPLGLTNSDCPFNCTALTWGEADHARTLLSTGYLPDVLVLVDVVYDPSIYQPLVDCLVLLCPPERAA